MSMHYREALIDLIVRGVHETAPSHDRVMKFTEHAMTFLEKEGATPEEAAQAFAIASGCLAGADNAAEVIDYLCMAAAGAQSRELERRTQASAKRGTPAPEWNKVRARVLDRLPAGGRAKKPKKTEG